MVNKKARLFIHIWQTHSKRWAFGPSPGPGIDAVWDGKTYKTPKDAAAAAKALYGASNIKLRYGKDGGEPYP